MPTDAGQRGSTSAPTVKKPVVPAPAPIPPKVVPNKTGQYVSVAQPKPVAKTAAPVGDITKSIGTDTTYQGTIADQLRQLATFLAGQQTSRTQEEAGYAQATRQRQQGQEQTARDTLDVFGGRGLARSSIYANALSDAVKKFTDQQNNLDLTRSNYLAGLPQQLQEFKDTQQAARTKAMSDAASRRAQQIAAVGGLK